MTAAATEQISTTSQWMDVLSPELVLVDPGLAEHARALLRDAAPVGTRDDVSVPEDVAAPTTAGKRSIFPVVFPDIGLRVDDAAAKQARQRLLDAGVNSEVIARIVPFPSKLRFRRWTTFFATSSAAATCAAVVLQAVLAQSMLG